LVVNEKLLFVVSHTTTFKRGGSLS